MSGPWEQYAAAPPEGDGPWTQYAPAPAAPSAPSMGGSALRGVTRGLTLGYADEIMGAVNGAYNAVAGDGFRPGYERARDTARQRIAADDATNPGSAIAGQVLGSVATPLGAVGRMAQGGATLGGAAIRGAGLGAGLGAVSGFGEAQGGLGQRVASAGIGAAVGGVAGGAMPLAIAGGAAAGGALSRAVGAADPEAAARRIITRDLARDGMTPADAAAASREAGNAPMALVDLGGPNLSGTGQAVARIPGQGPTMARALVESRGGAAQGERLAASVRSGIGGEDAAPAIDRIMAERSAVAAPMYERAYAVTLPRERSLERYLDLPEIRSGIQRGIALARREAVANDTHFDPASLGVRFDNAGHMALTGQGFPTRLFDVAKRGLDDAIEGQTDTITRKVTSEGRSLAELRAGLLREVDRLNPEFAAARSAYGDRSRLLDAINAGRGALNEGASNSEWTARRVLAMPPPEREAYRDGMRQALLDRIGRLTDAQDIGAVNNLFGSPAIRTRLRATFDTQAEYDAFSGNMRREMSMARNNGMLNPSSGSQTTPLLQRRADLERPPPGPVAGALMTPRTDFEGRPVPGAAETFFDRLRQGRGVSSALLSTPDAMMNAGRAAGLERNTSALAPMLFNPQPTARDAAINSLIEQQTRDAQRRGLLAPAARGLLGGAGISGGLLAN